MAHLKMNTLRTLPIALTLTTGLFLTACTEPRDNQNTDSITGPMTASTANTAIEQAQEEYTASQQVGHAWSSAQAALDAATTAHDAGDFARAASEADHAAVLAEASLVQASAEQGAWLERFPKAPEGKISGTSTQDSSEPEPE